MNTENKVISIAVGDRLQIEGVGTVELVVVAPEQPKINKQEWLNAASRLVDSWMRISGGYVPRASVESHTITYDFEKFHHITWVNIQTFPFNFETLEQKDQFIQENEKDLKIFFHQV
jgi:hypothetical protein